MQHLCFHTSLSTHTITSHNTTWPSATALIFTKLIEGDIPGYSIATTQYFLRGGRNVSHFPSLVFHSQLILNFKAFWLQDCKLHRWLASVTQHIWLVSLPSGAKFILPFLTLGLATTPGIDPHSFFCFCRFYALGFSSVTPGAVCFRVSEEHGVMIDNSCIDSLWLASLFLKERRRPCSGSSVRLVPQVKVLEEAVCTWLVPSVIRPLGVVHTHWRSGCSWLEIVSWEKTALI